MRAEDIRHVFCPLRSCRAKGALPLSPQGLILFIWQRSRLAGKAFRPIRSEADAYRAHHIVYAFLQFAAGVLYGLI